MSTNTSGLVRGVVSISKFLAVAYALWIVSGAIMWTVVRPYYMTHHPEAYMPVLASWFLATCIATWAVGQWY